MSDEKPQAWQRRDHSRDLTGLGWLEADVLRVVWDKGEVTVRDVYEDLRENRRISEYDFANADVCPVERWQARCPIAWHQGAGSYQCIDDSGR